MIAPGPRLRRNTRTPAAPRTAPGDALSRYTQRMEAVLDYLEAHFDEAPSIHQLAQAGGFVSEHFHRAFSAWMGESLADYRQRRRLDIAARQLAEQRQTPVLLIARALGYTSGDAFTQDFKERFACTPAIWRAQTLNSHEAPAASRRQNLPLQAVDRKNAPLALASVRLLTLPATRIAYLRHIGPYGTAVAQFWRETFLPWIAHNDLSGRDTFGIAHNDPQLGDPQQFRYDAGVAVAEDFIPRDEAGIATLPGGRYALAHYQGPAQGISQAWTTLLRDWLPASGQQLDNRPSFARHPANSPCPAQPDTVNCELCLPVKVL
ncbi:MAG: AraC family transcriptional regulator [Rhodocyclales bacterium]|nr:AraC family transcriptional regulator [Rhodocyclales bacterium]